MGDQLVEMKDVWMAVSRAVPRADSKVVMKATYWVAQRDADWAVKMAERMAESTGASWAGTRASHWAVMWVVRKDKHLAASWAVEMAAS
jgi:hypothetical protein